MDASMVMWFLYKAEQYQLSEESMSLWLDLIGFWQKTGADILSAH